MTSAIHQPAASTEVAAADDKGSLAFQAAGGNKQDTRLTAGGDLGDAATKSSKIMIVDDEPYNIMVVRKYLKEAGYREFVTTSESTQAMDLISHEHPDLVLLDINMPVVNGLEILRALRNDIELRYIPVLILTASTDSKTRLQALEDGATDFLAKPVDPSEMVLRVRNTLMVKVHQKHLESHSEQLEHQVRLRTEELAASRREVVYCLARAAEYRDHETGNHILRVSKYGGMIARQLEMSEDDIEMLEEASQLHDVGKIGVSDTILLKPGKLESHEFESMKAHCEYGRRIIEPSRAKRMTSTEDLQMMGGRFAAEGISPVMKAAAIIAYTHHERWDGTGYPEGLSGEDIPLEGRITAVADVYDALSSERPYKKAFSKEKCFALLEEGRGTHFDPRVLDAFFACSEDILRVQKTLQD